VPTALIVEDDAVLIELLAGTLRSRGFEVMEAGLGRAALLVASETEPDVIILDLGLPDVDGAEVCRQLRRWYRNPIVVLSADGDEDRKVAALELGADDYVTKPFSMRELLARINVALRHREVLDRASSSSTIRVGDLEIDAVGHVARLGDEPLVLPRKEFALLAELVRNQGRVLTHGTLLHRVWQTSDLQKTSTLRVHINALRRKLGEGPGRPAIVTEAGVGYRLVGPGSHDHS